MIVEARLAVGAPWSARAAYALDFLAAATGVAIRRIEDFTGEESVALLYAPSAALAAAKIPPPASGAQRLALLVPACAEGLEDADLLARVGSLADAPGLAGDPAIPLYGGRLLGGAPGTPPSRPAGAGRDLLPALSASPDAGEPGALRRSDPPIRRVILRFDLLANVFLHLSRLEETLTGERDRFGRFPASRSVLARDAALETPVVDRLAAYFLAILLRERPDTARIAARVAPWPGGEPSAILLTHDVDQSVSWPRRLARDAGSAARAAAALRLPDAARALARAAAHLAPALRDPAAYPRRVHEYERSAGVRSSWYFLTVPEDSEGRRYDVRSETYRRLLAEIAAHGSEVGLHGSIQASGARDAMARERAEIGDAAGRAPEGNRQHYLMLETPRSYRDLAAAGFAYDASLGYSETVGFRGGTSFPFRPYDTGNESAIDLLEIPFAFMDVARIRPGEREVALDGAWRDHLTRLEALGGLLAVLWHPRMFDPDTHPAGRAPYEALVAQAKARGIPFLTAAQIARWWRAREAARLVADEANGGGRRFRFATGGRLERFSVVLEHPAARPLRVTATGARAAARAGGPGRTIVTLEPDASAAEIVLAAEPSS